ncbi:MAG TPA: FtsH protease activity modulator HflK [Acidiferrobacteraceae bacterium]|nr:FtsH protease activity modulator HflK [Acidiferrobacteraceae bacterium]
MPWNQPGGSGGKDPWGQGGGQKGPPDLDEIVKKFQQRLSGLFGGGGSRGGGGNGGGSASSLSVGLIGVVVLLIWLASGIYIIDPAEKGIILQFGKFKEMTASGPHWHIPVPIERVEKVNVDAIRTVTHTAQMLTQDENLIKLTLSVQYQVKNAENFLFKVRDPDYTLREATESALREVVGSKSMDEIFSEGGGRAVLVNSTEKSIQRILDLYQAGLVVTKVNLERVQPPQAVQDAFEDAIKAGEDEDRFKKKAEAYERDIIPKAEGDAQRLIQEAQAYKKQVVEKALGETSRFLQTLKEYKVAPEITRKRLYLETMEKVLTNVSKVVVKVKQGNSLMYLPLDQIMRKSKSGSNNAPAQQDQAGSEDSQANYPSPKPRRNIGSGRRSR